VAQFLDGVCGEDHVVDIEHGLVERQQELQSAGERLGVGGALAVSDRATALC